MKAAVSRKFVEDLLTSFLSAALGLNMHERIEQLERLPASYRQKIDALLSEEVIWVAWMTALGVVTATGRYDHERSRQIGAHVLLIEWSSRYTPRELVASRCESIKRVDRRTRAYLGLGFVE